jgi:hypothetical protein
MIYGDCLRFTSTRWFSQGFSLRWVSAVGNHHFLCLNWWLPVLSTIPVCFFVYFLLGRVNIALCIPSGNEECALAQRQFLDFKLMNDT